MLVPNSSFDITYTQTIQNQRDNIKKWWKKETHVVAVNCNYLTAIPATPKTTVVWVTKAIAVARNLKEINQIQTK
jgi:hypothetical protein